MGTYYFEPQIDPNNPKDPNDPPPKGWDTDFDTSDFRKTLFGSPPRLMQDCGAWEEREMARLGYKVDYVNPRYSALGWVYTRTFVKKEESEPVVT